MSQSTSTAPAVAESTPDEPAFQTNRIFIGSLTKELEEFTIYKYCSAYGEITKCQIMKEPKTGRSRGYGFITFVLASSAEAFLKARPHYIGHHKIHAKPAFPTSEILVSSIAATERTSTSPLIHTKRLFVTYNVIDAKRNNLAEPAIFGYLSTFGVVKEIVQQFSRTSAEFEANPVNDYWIVDFLDEEAVDKCMAGGALHFVQGVRVYMKRVVSEQEVIRQKRQLEQEKTSRTQQLNNESQPQQHQAQQQSGHHYFFPPVNFQYSHPPPPVAQAPISTFDRQFFIPPQPPPPPPPQPTAPKSIISAQVIRSSDRTTQRIVTINGPPTAVQSTADNLLKGYGYQDNGNEMEPIPEKRHKHSHLY